MAIHKGSLWELSLRRIQSEVHVEVEIRHGDAIVSRVIDLGKVGGN